MRTVMESKLVASPPRPESKTSVKPARASQWRAWLLSKPESATVGSLELRR